MKKALLTISIILTLCLLTSCSVFKCANCQKEKNGTKHIYKTEAGESYAICSDCYKTAKSIFGK